MQAGRTHPAADTPSRGPRPQLSLDVKGNTSVNAETMQAPPPAAATEQARSPAVWVVRANGGQYTDLFLGGGYVAVGWFDLSSVGSLDDIRRLYGQSYPDAPAGQAANETGSNRRVLSPMSARVTT